MSIKVDKGRKIAVIVNGDREKRHIGNVQRAVKVLKKGGYHIYVASPVKPKGLGSTDRHVLPTREKIKRMIAGIRSTSKDYVVSYTTGHGERDGGVCMPAGCSRDMLKAIDAMKYKYRTVVMDTCYGGNNADMFMDDPRTLFISAGIKGKQVCCNNFAPKFWDDAKNIKDTNPDGVKGWRERAEHAHIGHHDKARLFLMTNNYSDYDVESGKHVTPEFAAKPMVEVNSVSEYAKQIKRLKPGQYAVLAFSASWCRACPAYKKKFKQQAAAGKGKQLFIWSKSKALARKFNNGIYPNVIIIDAFGNTYEVKNRYKIHDRLKRLNLTANQMAMTILKKFAFNPDSVSYNEIQTALSAISNNPRELKHADLKEALAILHTLTRFKRFSERAVMVYKHLVKWIGPDGAAAEVAAVRKLIKAGYDNAVELYEEAIKSLPVSKIEPEMKAFVNLRSQSHRDYKVAELKTLGRIFQNLFKDLKPERQRAWITIIGQAPNTTLGIIACGKIGIWTDNTSFHNIVRSLRAIINEATTVANKGNAAIIALSELSSRLSLNERIEISKHIRSTFLKKGTMLGLEDAYSRMVADFNESQNKKLVANLMNVLSVIPTKDVIYEIIEKHIHNLKGPIVSRLEELIRHRIDRTIILNTRTTMLRIYATIAPFVSQTSARKMAVKTRNQFYEYSYDLRRASYRTYTTLLPHLSTGEKLKAFMILGKANAIKIPTKLFPDALAARMAIVRSLKGENQIAAILDFASHLKSRDAGVIGLAAQLITKDILLLEQSTRSALAKKMFAIYMEGMDKGSFFSRNLPAESSFLEIIYSLKPTEIIHYLDRARMIHQKHPKSLGKRSMASELYLACIDCISDKSVLKREYDRLTEMFAPQKADMHIFAARFIAKIAAKLEPGKLRAATKLLWSMTQSDYVGHAKQATIYLFHSFRCLPREQKKRLRALLISRANDNFLLYSERAMMLVLYSLTLKSYGLIELKQARIDLLPLLKTRPYFFRREVVNALSSIDSLIAKRRKTQLSHANKSASDIIMPDPLKVPVEVP